MPTQSVFPVVSALEVETDEYSDEAGDEEDDDHYYPTVVLVYPVWSLAIDAQTSTFIPTYHDLCPPLPPLDELFDEAVAVAVDAVVVPVATAALLGTTTAVLLIHNPANHFCI